MRNKYNDQLKTLNKEMVSMCDMIQNAIQESIEALFSQDVEKAKKIMDDDEFIDQEKKKIENMCFQLIVQQQPVAHDLRNITAAMKMVTDMERIGDHAADISELTVILADCPYRFNEKNLRQMAGEAIVMLLEAMQAYVEKDIGKAKEVIERDDIVDELFIKVKSDLIDVMSNNPDYAEHAADLLMVNKYLERIGDHATNIAEWVIFAIEEPSI